jgi:diguanylate cyclase (GGDEF)-like protein
MRIETLSLRTRLGRRVFLLFVICALLPIGVTSVLAFTHAERVTRERQAERLRDYSENYGLAMLQRLEMADAAMRLLERSGVAATTDTLRASLELATFVRAAAISDASGSLSIATGSIDSLPRPDAPARERLAVGEHWLAVAPGGEAQSARIFLVSSVTGAALSELLYFELDPNFVFGDPAHLPFRTEVRVTTLRGETLHHGAAMETVVADGKVDNTGEPAGVGGEADVLAAASWELFLGGRFAVPSWIIETTQPRARSGDGDSGLLGIFPWTIAGALVIVVLVSSIQIRRSLVPLDELLRGTRRIAARDFDTQVRIYSRDEFGELAASFNQMSDSLRVQFKAFEALAEIDRLILSAPSIERILDTLLKQVRQVADCACVSVTLIDPDGRSHGRVYVDDGEHGAAQDVKRVLLGNDLEALSTEGDGKLIDLGADQPIPAYATHVAHSGARWALVQPVRGMNGLVAILTLGFVHTSADGAFRRNFARDFADRLAVALSNLEREERLYRQAHYDDLTGMPNRQLFKDRLQHEIALAGRAGESLALLYVDLDNFKRVNDTLGHDAGDELLRIVGARLAACVKQSDTVARLGGDEFVIVLGGLPGPEPAAKAAERILAELAIPLEIRKREFRGKASIGIAMYPDDGTTLEELLKNADTAMFRAKAEGRGRATFFEASMNARAMERWSLETGLHRALQQRQFILHYQPQLHLASGALSGAEALIRWACPLRGRRAPAEFIPAAEESGLIVDIGNWVMNEACEQHRRWRRQGVEVPLIAINVSPDQLRHADFVENVKAALLRSDTPPWALELEITESVLLSEQERATRALSELVELGVSLALDDFGTGYSSLGYLRRYPMQVIKIDRSFVTDLPDNADAAAIASAVVAMARTLGKRTIAEGIETTAQLDFLKSLGCECGQGFLFAHPMPAEELAQFVAEHRASVAKKGPDPFGTAQPDLSQKRV